MMWGMGLFNRAYINKLYPKVTIISGLQLKPIRLDDNEENIQRVINLFGTIFYPMSLTLLMPLFIMNYLLLIFLIVLQQKEQGVHCSFSHFKFIYYCFKFLKHIVLLF